jgi:hypothetical protein
MITFPQPITFRLLAGYDTTRTRFPLVLIDAEHQRLVTAILPPSTNRITLWAGDAYDAAGDYTQAQAEARVIEVLGSDPAALLSAPVSTPAPTPLP